MSRRSPAAAVPDALLRLWILAGLGLAALHIWLAWRMRDWPADLPGPQPWRPVEISQFMALFVMVPAAVVVWQRWRARRDGALAGLAILYALASAASFMARAQGGTAGMIFTLHLADAAIAFIGVAVAMRAIRG